MGTANKIEINPVIADATPAIWPTGSIAIARRFPKRKPMAKNCKAKKTKSTANEGFGLL